MIDIKPKDLDSIKDILRHHCPDKEVWAYGSRVNGKAKPYSDLDLVIISQKKIPLKNMAALSNAFQESNLLFRVDIIDWMRISEEFKAIIKNNYCTIIQL